MDNNRAAVINIGGQDYRLILTAGATKAIAKRYGGLEELGDKLMKYEKFEEGLDEVLWLIALLANQAVYIHNMQHPDDPKAPLSAEMLELLTTPAELNGYAEAINEALIKGTKRNVISADEPKKKQRRADK